jgi:two-component system chemotaxis response regulator CheB
VGKLKVLVVDDTIVYRKILSATVNHTGMAIATQTASNGEIALEYVKQQSFDVVLLDMVMSDMNGLEVLAALKKNHENIVVIMISSGGPECAIHTVQALKNGALDFIIKPQEDNFERNVAMLSEILQSLFLAIQVKKSGGDMSFKVVPQLTRVEETMISKRIDLVIIAASTGGPHALEVVLGKLPENFQHPILIVQHMPPVYTKILANMLDVKCHLSVREAKQGDVITAGQVLIAPGGHHMLVKKGNDNKYSVELKEEPCINGLRPSADVLFQSVAQAYKGKNVLIVILTGMGRDGKIGVMEIKKECSCYCIAQSEGTCVVYGMPHAVVESGLADESIDLESIGKRIGILSQK